MASSHRPLREPAANAPGGNPMVVDSLVAAPLGRQPTGCPAGVNGVKDLGAAESILTHAPIPFAAMAGAVHPAGINSRGQGGATS